MSDDAVTWKVLEVTFLEAEFAFPDLAMRGNLESLEGAIIGKAVCQMDDGRRFMSMHVILKEFWEQFGEEGATKLVVSAARPPEEELT